MRCFSFWKCFAKGWMKYQAPLTVCLKLWFALSCARQRPWKKNKLSFVSLKWLHEAESWEATSCSATQEFPNILWTPNVHYRVHKSPPLVSVMSHIHTFYTLGPVYLKR
jgi:hypothetical protein